MNEVRQKPIRRFAFFAAIVFAIPFLLFFGPLLVHAFHRATTSEAAIQQQRKEYRRLDAIELVLSGAAKTNSQKARYKLFLWFHARGLSIDEGDEEYSLWRPWIELFDYWRGDDGSRFFLNPTNGA